MEASILKTIRNMLIGEMYVDEESAFDDELIIHINTNLLILNQLGCGVEGFQITGPNEEWSDFIPDPNGTLLGLVKTFIWAKVKIAFDSRSSSTLLQSINQIADETAWRINLIVDRAKNVT